MQILRSVLFKECYSSVLLGEYSHDGDYYSVLTDEADRIAELVAGYIDLLLKRRKVKEQPLQEGTSCIGLNRVVGL